MLTIRHAQFQAMKERKALELAQSLRDYFRVHCAEEFESLDDARLDELIVRGARQADEYGLSSAPAIGWFVLTQQRISPRFDEEPAIRACLEEPALSDLEKVRELVRAVSSTAWARARSR